MSARISNRWKHQWLWLLYVATALLLVTTAFAQNANEENVPSEQATSNDEGQTLFKVAMKHLHAIDSSETLILDRKKRDSSRSKLMDVLAATAHKASQVFGGLWFFDNAQPDSGDDQHKESLSENEYYLLTAKLMLEKAANVYGNHDAMLALADMNFFAKYTCPRNFTAALTYYDMLASTGNATAQYMMGFMYATGIDNAVEKDQARALVYYTFAANGGDTLAEMTLGYRSLFGIGMEQKCETAAYYYHKVAEKSINYYLSGPPGGRSLPLSKARLADENGGVYGYGASMITDNRFRQNIPSSDRHVDIEEVLKYWRYHAQTRSDFDTLLMLGQIYYEGTRSIPRNFKEALFFFQQAAENITPEKIAEILDPKRKKVIGQAAGYLGRMYLRGEGVKQDLEMAYKWFHIGAQLNDPIAQNGMGVLYLNGAVVPQNRDEALAYFKRAATQGYSEAQVNLAAEYVKHESTLSHAVQLFTMAAESKNLMAYWYLAQLNYQGMGLKRSCQMAVSFYKAIAEIGDWLHPTVEMGYSAFMEGDDENALLYYMIAAERGYEVAQSNAAYMLDQDTRLLNLDNIFGTGVEQKRDKASDEYALIYWSRAANQNNVDARVKRGDYYFKGIGTPVDYEKAADCYRIAAEFEFSPMAMWNLGWMYENGIGVPQDFYLAKRSYDNALATQRDAYLPVRLSLAKLYLKYYWRRIIGSETSEHFFKDQKEDASWSGNSNNDNSDAAASAAAQEAKRRKEIEAFEHERAHREIGAEEELRRKYSKHRKQHELEDGDDTTLGSGYNDDYDDDDLEYSEEDELVESILIFCLCVVIGWLVYIRQFWYGNQAPRGNNNNAAGEE